jgi:hypothetical protein
MKINFFSNELPKNIDCFQDILDFVKSQEELTKDNSKYEFEINDSGESENSYLSLGKFVILLKNHIMSDDEFSDVDDKVTCNLEEKFTQVAETEENAQIIENKEFENKEPELSEEQVSNASHISSEKTDNVSISVLEMSLVDKNVTNEVKEDKIVQDIKENQEKEKLWMEYELQNKILKYLINYSWIDEKFHIRETIKYYSFFNNDIKINSSCYLLKNYPEKTVYFLPKLALAYSLFCLLEKCPYEELLNTIFMKYLARVFKVETPIEVLMIFSMNDFTSSLEKCLHFYSLLYLVPVEERMKDPMFLNFGFLELEKQKLEKDWTPLFLPND